MSNYQFQMTNKFQNKNVKNYLSFSHLDFIGNLTLAI
jgi:hypothetical protein